VVTHQLQVERRTGKVRRPETDVLPLCHATVYKRQIYQIAKSNRIEKIDSVARIESNRIETFFCPNWNALVASRLCWFAADPCAGFVCPATFTCQLDELRRPVCRCSDTCSGTCSDTCSGQVAPVCASDGRSYRSECRMRLHACRTEREIHVVARSPCSAGHMLSHPTRRRGVAVSGVRRMNQVNAHRARLVLGWVTVFGRVYFLKRAVLATCLLISNL